MSDSTLAAKHKNFKINVFVPTKLASIGGFKFDARHLVNLTNDPGGLVAEG